MCSGSTDENDLTLISHWFQSLNALFYLQHRQRQSVIPPLCFYEESCHRELLSSCASLCLQTVSHQNVLSHFQDGMKCVGALCLHEHRLLYRLLKSQCKPYVGLWPIRAAPYFSLGGATSYSYQDTGTHTRAQSVTSAAVLCHMFDRMRQVPEYFSLNLCIYLVFAFTCWV